MTKREEEQCFNDGRLAFRQNLLRGAGCPKKAREPRAAWQRGWDYEQRRSMAEKATPEQLEKGRELLGKLKEFVSKL